MPTLRDIKKRIHSVQNTKQITRTMEMVAAAKISKASARVTAATPYSDSMAEMLESVAGHAAGLDHPLLAVREDCKRVLVITVVSDRGLAGGFNSNVLRKVEAYLREQKAQGVECEVIACGKKAAAYFKYRGIEPTMTFRDLSADPTLEEAREIAQEVIDRYSSTELDEVVIVYNHARNNADQDLRMEQVLPIATENLVALATKEPELAEAVSESEEDSNTSYEYEPEPADVLAGLLPAYVQTTIYHALIDSAAAEQGARRKAMKAATDNAEDMITTLTRIYNYARQGAITTEISEIVGGAAALEE